MRIGPLAGCFLVGCSCGSCFTVRDAPGFSHRKLPPHVYEQALRASPGAVLIDVRTSAEYGRGHAEGTRSNSFLRPGFARRMGDLPRDTPIFLYCHSCHRSPLAARRLKRHGFAGVIDLEGGYRRWKQAGPAPSR